MQESDYEGDQMRAAPRSTNQLREEIATALRAQRYSAARMNAATDAVVEVVVRHLTAREPDGPRTVLAGGPERLAADLAAALNAAHERALQRPAGDHDLASETGHDRVATLLSRANELPNSAGWHLGRAHEMAMLPVLQSAIRELAIARDVLEVGPSETRRAGMLADRVHAAIDELDSLHLRREDGE